MAKATTAVAAEQPVESAGTPLTLTEFCMRLSEREPRVALIGAFEAAEKKAGRVKDTDSAYQSRYDAFVNKPA